MRHQNAHSPFVEVGSTAHRVLEPRFLEGKGASSIAWGGAAQGCSSKEGPCTDSRWEFKSGPRDLAIGRKCNFGGSASCSKILVPDMGVLRKPCSDTIDQTRVTRGLEKKTKRRRKKIRSRGCERFLGCPKREKAPS